MVAHRILYARSTRRHFEFLTGREQKAVFDAVDRQLAFEPTLETRNRKRMRPNPLATWELRIGPLRVYYDILSEPEPAVLVVAVGVKDRDLIRIGGDVVRL